jgi:hypothetical protein
MSLLDNELVRKYFDVPIRGPNTMESEVRQWMSLRIIEAMQAPIKRGERFLVVNNVDNEIRVLEEIWGGKDYFGPHFYELRLPDRFQWKFELPRKKLHECNCEFCGSPETLALGETDEEQKIRTAPYAVEEKIQSLSFNENKWAIQHESGKWLAKELRDLVALARKT